MAWVWVGLGRAGAEAQERCNVGPFTDPVHSSMHVSRRTHRRRSRHGPGQTLTNRWVLRIPRSCVLSRGRSADADARAGCMWRADVVTFSIVPGICGTHGRHWPRRRRRYRWWQRLRAIRSIPRRGLRIVREGFARVARQAAAATSVWTAAVNACATREGAVRTLWARILTQDQ